VTPERALAAVALLLPELRSPVEPMRPFTLKLPAQLLEALDRQAAAYGTPRSAIASTLLAMALEQLEQLEPTAAAIHDSERPQLAHLGYGLLSELDNRQ
jgi:hypothetical protein